MAFSDSHESRMALFEELDNEGAPEANLLDTIGVSDDSHDSRMKLFEALDAGEVPTSATKPKQPLGMTLSPAHSPAPPRRTFLDETVNQWQQLRAAGPQFMRGAADTFDWLKNVPGAWQQGVMPGMMPKDSQRAEGIRERADIIDARIPAPQSDAARGMRAISQVAGGVAQKLPSFMASGFAATPFVNTANLVKGTKIAHEAATFGLHGAVTGEEPERDMVIGGLMGTGMGVARGLSQAMPKYLKDATHMGGAYGVGWSIAKEEGATDVDAHIAGGTLLVMSQYGKLGRKAAENEAVRLNLTPEETKATFVDHLLRRHTRYRAQDGFRGDVSRARVNKALENIRLRRGGVSLQRTGRASPEDALFVEEYPFRRTKDKWWMQRQVREREQVRERHETSELKRTELEYEQDASAEQATRVGDLSGKHAKELVSSEQKQTFAEQRRLAEQIRSEREIVELEKLDKLRAQESLAGRGERVGEVAEKHAKDIVAAEQKATFEQQRRSLEKTKSEREVAEAAEQDKAFAEDVAREQELRVKDKDTWQLQKKRYQAKLQGSKSGMGYRKITEIAKDVNTALGEGGFFGKGKKKTQPQVDAEARLRRDLQLFKEDARRSGRSLSAELQKQKVPADAAAALLQLDRGLLGTQAKTKMAPEGTTEARVQESQPQTRGFKFTGNTKKTGGVVSAISETSKALYAEAQKDPVIGKSVEHVKNVMEGHDRNIRRAEYTAMRLEQAVQELVPDPKRQMLIVHSLESKMKGEHWDQLTAAEKEVARWLRSEKVKLNEFVDKNELLERMDESEHWHLYHAWNNPKTGRPYKHMYGKTSKGLPAQHQRKVPTYKAGMEGYTDPDTGKLVQLKPSTTNPGKIIGLELQAATRAAETRKLFSTLMAEDGPEIIVREKGPFGRGTVERQVRLVEKWKHIDEQGLSKQYVELSSMGDRTRDLLGDKFFVQQGKSKKLKLITGRVGVHKDLAPFVKAYVESPNYGTFSQLHMTAKSMVLGLSGFHPMSLAWQRITNRRIPFVQSTMAQGKKLQKELGPETGMLYENGLDLPRHHTPEDYYPTFQKGKGFLLYSDPKETGTPRLTAAGNMAKKTINAIATPANWSRDIIFGENGIHIKMKLAFAYDSLRHDLRKAIRTRAKKDNIKLNDMEIDAEYDRIMDAYQQGQAIPKYVSDIARDAVRVADSHFSGEHYKRSMLEGSEWMAKYYYSPAARKVWMNTLLSPTWQKEHVVVATEGGKAFVPKKVWSALGMDKAVRSDNVRSEYRKYWYTAAFIYLGPMNVWNRQMTEKMDGVAKNIWENDDPFSIRMPYDTPEYITVDKNGKKRRHKSRPAYMRPLKSIFEVAGWAKDPIKKVISKSSPFARVVLDEAADARYGRDKTAGEFLLDVGDTVMTPIIVDQAIEAAQGKKWWKDVLFSWFGAPVYGPKDKKKSGQKAKSRKWWELNK